MEEDRERKTPKREREEEDRERERKVLKTKSVADGYSLRTLEFVNGDSSQVLERRYGYQHLQIIHLKGLIVNQPGIVAAVGGIPDKLKLGFGISFWFPCPTFTVPMDLPEDPTARHEALLEAYEQSSEEKEVFKQGFVRAYRRALNTSLVKDEDEAEDEDMDKQHVTMVEVNLAMPLDPCGLYLNPHYIPTHPIPIKQAEVSRQHVEYGYSIITLENPNRGSVLLLRRDCGDSSETRYLKGVISIKPGIVVAAGVIPRNLRLNVGISFRYPSPVLKIQNVPPNGPAARKIVSDAFERATDENVAGYLKAYSKAIKHLEPSVAYLTACNIAIKKLEPSGEKELDMEEPYTMLEMNMAHPEFKIARYHLMHVPAEHLKAVIPDPVPYLPRAPIQIIALMIGLHHRVAADLCADMWVVTDKWARMYGLSSGLSMEQCFLLARRALSLLLYPEDKLFGEDGPTTFHVSLIKYFEYLKKLRVDGVM